MVLSTRRRAGMHTKAGRGLDGYESLIARFDSTSPPPRKPLLLPGQRQRGEGIAGAYNKKISASRGRRTRDWVQHFVIGSRAADTPTLKVRMFTLGLDQDVTVGLFYRPVIREIYIVRLKFFTFSLDVGLI